jgi:hypothetical protein
MKRRELVTRVLPALCLAPFTSGCPSAPLPATPAGAEPFAPSLASTWLDLALEATAREVDRHGPRPTVLSRTLAIPLTAMFDAWAAYDATALSTRTGAELRRPAHERTLANKKEAISYAAMRALLYVYAEDADYIQTQMRRLGYDPAKTTADRTTPAGIGLLAADAVIAHRTSDGANQDGKAPGGDGTPYGDTTGYVPVSSVEKIVDPDRWQPIAFDDGKGGHTTPGYLTPHWGRVLPFALTRGDQLRPGPPPKVGTERLFQEAREVLELNAALTCEQKALVELMRDGPRSTGQSGHWLKFAQMVSLRDRNELDRDVKLYFAVANVAMDAFIAAWDAKLAYDSSRPWTLIHHYFKGKDVRGWGGPNRGTITMKGEDWRPYSPSTFITPPFPGYVSGHSCVSGASAEMLRLFTGSDVFGVVEHRRCGELTGEAEHGEDITLKLPTFTATAEMAGISRVLGGYHIPTDNVEGLRLGRRVASAVWPKLRGYFG